MTIRWNRGLWVYAGSPPGGSAWAVLPLVAWMPAWMLEEEGWFRRKVQVHERVHWCQQRPHMVPAWVAASSLLAWVGWPSGLAGLLAALVVVVLGTLPWLVRYAASPRFRLDVEVEAEAAEKAWLMDEGRWRADQGAIDEYVESHLQTYYGRRPLLGEPPTPMTVEHAFLRALADRGVRVDGGGS